LYPPLATFRRPPEWQAAPEGLVAYLNSLHQPCLMA
jgi:hypothetical protein